MSAVWIRHDDRRRGRQRDKTSLHEYHLFIRFSSLEAGTQLSQIDVSSLLIVIHFRLNHGLLLVGYLVDAFGHLSPPVAFVDLTHRYTRLHRRSLLHRLAVTKCLSRDSWPLIGGGHNELHLRLREKRGFIIGLAVVLNEFV